MNDSALRNGYNPCLNNSADANQMKVYNKLDELKKALNNSQEAQGTNYQSRANPYSLKSYSSSNDAERLQSMMQKMNEDKTQDPEISQLNDMLDKIQAIQNPEQTKIVAKPDSNKNLAVANKDYTAGISLLKSDVKSSAEPDTNIANTLNAFYSTTAFDANIDSNFNNTIEAIIPETQTIVSGSTIKLALDRDVIIQHITIPAGTSIYGTTSLSNERLDISVTSIRYQSSILPVAMKVYDMDGQEGIYIPGSINRTVAKESANNAISEMNPTSIDPSVGAQAVSAGIEAAKTLASRKMKLIKMTVRAGYKVLLKNNNDK